MSKKVIKVQNLSKRYRIGLKEKRSETLISQVKSLFKSPWRNFKRLQDMSVFVNDDESVFMALNDVSFDVEEGEVLGIIGRNGAGKSTLLKILSQITEPTSGKIEINGRVASLLEVGTGFHPELSGRENIYMNGTILGMTRREIDNKLDEIIDFSGVEKFIDTPVKFYSSGMKVRLGFSVAAHLDPEILIIDEVLAVGDYEFQRKCLGKMEDLSRNQGRTVLFVSHNIGSVRKLCSKGLLLNNGLVDCFNSTSIVLEKYLFEYSTNTSLLLSDRKDREGTGEIKVIDVKIKSSVTGMELSEVLPGMDLEVKVYFKVFDLALLNSPIEIGIVLTTDSDQFITVLNNVMSNYPLMINSNEGVFTCTLKRFPLTEGKFTMRLMLKGQTVIYDLIENAFSFFVHKGDFYSSGKVNSHGRQGVYIDQKWV